MKSIITNSCTTQSKTRPRKKKRKHCGSGILSLIIAAASLSVQTQGQPQVFYYADKNIDAAGNLQLAYGAARMTGTEASVANLCYDNYSQYIIDKESNILIDADNAVYFLKLVPDSGGFRGYCSSMDLVYDFNSQWALNLNGPMDLTVTYKKTTEGYLSGINFQTSTYQPLGFQVECGSDSQQSHAKTLIAGELEIASAVLSVSPEKFWFVDPNGEIEENCNHMWKITYSSNVILLGTNGEDNADNQFDVFGIYYRLANLQELSWSAETQQITVDATDKKPQVALLALQSIPALPSPIPTILWEITHLDPPNLNFNGGAANDIKLNGDKDKVDVPDLKNVVPGIYKFTVTAKDSVDLTISASYTLLVIVVPALDLSFTESLVTVERERGVTSAISIQTLTMTPANPSPAPSLEYTLSGDLDFAGQTTTQLVFHALNPPTQIDLPSTTNVAINTEATVTITVTDTISAATAQYVLKIIVIPDAQCSGYWLWYDQSDGANGQTVSLAREYDNNASIKWKWSRGAAGCDIFLSCSTSPATIDLCSSGNDLTITQTKDVVVYGTYSDTFEWSLNTVDKVTYPPGVYTMTVVVNMMDTPSQTLTQVLTLTLTDSDTCNNQISVDAIPVQEIYVGDSASTFQVTSTELPASCALSKVYAFSGTSVSSWMTIDANGLITLQATDQALRGTFTPTVSVSLPGYEAQQGQAAFSVVIKTCDDLTLFVPSATPFNPSSYTYKLQGPNLTVSLPTTVPYASLSYSLDCGPLSVIFLQSKDGGVSSALDSAIFTKDAEKITIAASDESMLGTYVVEYDVSLANFPSVPTVKFTYAFTVKILAYYEMNFVSNEVQNLSPDPFGGVVLEPIRSLVLQPAAPSPAPTILFTIIVVGQGPFFSGRTTEPIAINASQEIVIPNLANVAQGTYTCIVTAKDSVYPDSIKAQYNLEISVVRPFSFVQSLQKVERQMGNPDPISLQELVKTEQVTGLVYSLTGDLDFGGQTATQLAFDSNEDPSAILVPSTINMSGPFPVTAVLVVKVTQTSSQAYAQYEVRISIPDPYPTCNQQISVDAIPVQEIYVGDSASTFQVTSTELPTSCALSKLYAFSDTSVSSWMTIDANGLITLQATDQAMRGTFTQTVSVSLLGYEAQQRCLRRHKKIKQCLLRQRQQQGQAVFSVVIKICSSLTRNSDSQIQGSEYTLGSGVVQLAYVEKQKSDCNSTKLTLTPSFAELGPAFNLTQIEQGWIKLKVKANSTKELTLGSHTVKISEDDVYSGFKTLTTIRFNVLANPTQPLFVGFDIPNLNQTESNSTEPIADISDDKEDNQTEVSNEEKATEEDIDQLEESDETSTSENTVFEPKVQIGENGEITYPWQTKIKLQRKERKKFKIDDDEEIVPLKASVQSLSPTGNLTIAFNKPLILPPIRVDNYTQVVNSTATEARLLQEEEVSSYKYDIKDVVDLKIESSFHVEDSSIIKIKGYNLTRLTETAMDIQIQFQHPDLLTQSAQEPDAIKIQFKKEGMFMDELDLLQLDSDLEVMFAIQPQKTAEEIEALEKLGEDMASSMTTLSIVIIILQFFLAMGLKYLWNIMNLLQFLIFMQTWQILLPSTTSIVLKQLKVLALGEFLPTDFFKSTLKKILGLEQEQEEYSCADQDCEISPKAGEEKSIAVEETGIDRIGSNDLIDNMGAMLLIAAVLVFTILILVFLRFIAKRCPCAQKAYVSIKKKLFYNTLLRYVLQSTLKLQIAAGAVIGYDMLTTSQEDSTETNTGSKVFSWVTIVVLNLCPFLFYLVVMRNQSNLDKPVIREKIGTLYNGFRTSSTGTKSYYFVFLVRRTLFVLITFLLFSQPGIQVQLMIYMTLLYVIYLGHSEFFEQFSRKSMEIFNESVFVLIQYCFVLLANLVWEQTVRTRIGEIIIALTAILIAINMILIIVVSIKALCWNLHLKKLKKKHAVLMLDRQEAKKIQSQQQIERQMVLKAVREAQQEEAKAVVRNVSSASESQSQDQSSSSLSKEKSSDQSEIGQEVAKLTNVEVVAKMQHNKNGMLQVGLSSIFEPKEEHKLKKIELKLKSSSSSRLGMNSHVSTYGRQSDKSVVDHGFLAVQSQLGLRTTGSVINHSRWPPHRPKNVQQQDTYLKPPVMPSTLGNKEVRIKYRNNAIAQHQSELLKPPSSFAESFQNIPIRIKNQNLPLAATRNNQEKTTGHHSLRFD